MWKRWGSPTGSFRSGFEEEFERALKRWRETRVPELWLYFKSVASDQLADPGEQLRSVIAFRDRLEAQREVLFKTFSNESEWKDLLCDTLLKYLLQRLQLRE